MTKLIGQLGLSWEETGHQRLTNNHNNNNRKNNNRKNNNKNKNNSIKQSNLFRYLYVIKDIYFTIKIFC